MNLKLHLSMETQLITRLPGQEWQPYDQSPGIFEFDPDREIGIRVQNINDQELFQLLTEIEAHPQVIFLNLSENRKITDRGLDFLKMIPHLKMLNLSSCDITDVGMPNLKKLRDLEWLNISFCNRLTIQGVKLLSDLPHLEFLDLQGSIRIKKADVKRLNFRNVTIHK